MFFLNMFISQLPYCTSGLILHFTAGKKSIDLPNYHPGVDNNLPRLTFCKSVSKYVRTHKCFPLTLPTTKDARDNLEMIYTGRENLTTF